jgi:antitoxin component of MazEF toxin-antitoxin module
MNVRLRLIQVGNSVGVTIPPAILRAQGLKKGDVVDVEWDRIVKVEVQVEARESVAAE